MMPPPGGKVVFDGGEKRACAVGKDERPAQSGYPNRFMNSLIVAIISTAAGGRHGNGDGLRLLALPHQGGGGPAVLHPVDAHAAARRRRHPDVPDVPRGRAERTRIGA
jgi:hypothetical protein